MNKTILDLKREVDTIKKTQSEAMLEIETLGKKPGTIASATEYKRWNRESQVQSIPERTCAQQSKKIHNAKRS